MTASRIRGATGRGSRGGRGAAALSGGFGACLFWVSASSLENNTRAPPRPTRTMPSHNFQPGNSTPKRNSSPAWDARTCDDRVDDRGRPKIRGQCRDGCSWRRPPAADLAAKMTDRARQPGHACQAGKSQADRLRGRPGFAARHEQPQGQQHRNQEVGHADAQQAAEAIAAQFLAAVGNQRDVGAPR